MSILSNYLKSIKKNIIISALFGICASISQTLLVILISKLETNAKFLGKISGDRYFTLILIFFIANFIFSILIAKISQFSSYKIQEILCKKILELPLKVIETLGYHKLQAALTQDTLIIANFISILPNLIIYITVVLSCLVYLSTLSIKIFLIASFLLSFLLISFVLLDKFYINQKLTTAREIINELYNNFNGLLIGGKELKLDKAFRESFVKDALLKNAYSYYINNFNTMAALSFWQTMWQALLFLLIGLILFHGQSTTAVLQQSITIILFISAPLVSLINSLPALRRSIISIAKMKEIDESINDVRELEKSEEITTSFCKIHSLKINSIKYKYNVGANHFELGPINIEFLSSQVTFIVGKNGSGKSTLVKLLSGLYQPDQGQLILNNIPISQYNLNWYRDQVSVLFYNYYLFENFILQDNHIDTIIDLSKQLEIENFVNIENKTYAQLEASDGLRRRLAFLNMAIQNKPILILDEPTSDQDAAFKQFFYHKLIPLLKKDRCLIIISHDPSYYSLADKIIYLEQGKVVDKKLNEIFNTEEI